jgi:hypothetical protein
MGPHLWGRGLVSSEQSIEKNIAKKKILSFGYKRFKED